jgi:hypothetical protein
MTKTELTAYISAVADDALAECKSENPLEAWTRFIDLLDARVRRRIGDELERTGKNRYTGKPLERQDAL